jgi:hypothetical protein
LQGLTVLAAHDVAAPLLFELERDEVLSRLAVRGLSRPALSELSEAVIEGPASARSSIGSASDPGATRCSRSACASIAGERSGR